MSRRAYRIISVEYDEVPAFNLTYDETLVGFLTKKLGGEAPSYCFDTNRKWFEEFIKKYKNDASQKEVIENLQRLLNETDDQYILFIEF